MLQNAPWDAAGFGDLSVAPAEIAPADTARFDLTVSAVEFEGRLWLGFEYCTDLFDAATIERLGAGFETLLAASSSEPAAPIWRRCRCRRGRPVQRQLHEWQPGADGCAPVDSRASTNCFGAQAGRTPDATAVECGGVPAELRPAGRAGRGRSPRACRRGHDGRRARGHRLERSVDMLAAVLGVLRAGGFYLPLDPGHPAARRAFILQDSGAAAARDFTGGAGRRPRILGGSGSPAVSARRRPPAMAPSGRPARLPHLHLRLHRPAQGRGRVPSGAVVNFLAAWRRTPGLAAGRPAARRHDARLRHRGAGAAAAADRGRDHGHGRPMTTCGIRERLMQTHRRGAASRCCRRRRRPGATCSRPAGRGTPGLRLLCGGEALDRDLATRLLGTGRGTLESLRTDGNHRLVLRRTRPRRAAVPSASAGRSPTRAATCSTSSCSRCRSARGANSGSAATAWRSVITAGRN